QFTSKSPQLHHKNTTLKPHGFTKPPVKTAFPPRGKKLQNLAVTNRPSHLSNAKRKAQTVLHLRCSRGTGSLQIGPYRSPPGPSPGDSSHAGLHRRRKNSHCRHRHRLHSHPRTAARRKAYRTRPPRTDSQP